MVRVLVKFWREHGIRIACYLDDGLGCGKEFSITEKDSKFVKESLEAAGFVVNNEKSIWVPSYNIIWLGIEYDSAMGRFSISEKRVDSLMRTIYCIIEGLPYSRPREVARLCGKLASTKFVLGNIVQLKARRLHRLISSGNSWDSRISFEDHPEALDELFFWRNKFKCYNYRFVGKYIAPLRGYSDASSTGIAAHISLEGSTKIASKALSPIQRQMGSTWRELYAIKLTSFWPYIGAIDLH